MTKARDLGPVDYSGVKAPPLKYRCDDCKAYGCKMWRDYQTFLNHQTVRCADCACAAEKKDATQIDRKGRLVTEERKSDQIGALVPAVPSEDGSTYWGYTSVPEAGVKWWKRLPSRPATR